MKFFVPNENSVKLKTFFSSFLLLYWLQCKKILSLYVIGNCNVYSCISFTSSSFGIVLVSESLYRSKSILMKLLTISFFFSSCILLITKSQWTFPFKMLKIIHIQIQKNMRKWKSFFYKLILLRFIFFSHINLFISLFIRSYSFKDLWLSLWIDKCLICVCVLSKLKSIIDKSLLISL